MRTKMSLLLTQSWKLCFVKLSEYIALCQSRRAPSLKKKKKRKKEKKKKTRKNSQRKPDNKSKCTPLGWIFVSKVVWNFFFFGEYWSHFTSWIKMKGKGTLIDGLPFDLQSKTARADVPAKRIRLSLLWCTEIFFFSPVVTPLKRGCL